MKSELEILEQRRDEILQQLEDLRRRQGLDDMMTPKEVAFVVGYHQESIRQWAEAGKVEGKKIGGRWLVSKKSVINFVNRKLEVSA